ncbi:hypothetical protein NDR87_19690 [Nocardia sp. CDC159]|uniref:Excreted virulence factor EspC (Type VII ESX diderm) n=1 Tax=Nocardia pulmonis TaxID=2951408 RepID=A0A9X2ED69_9NOCA|nr:MULTISPECIES: hypothetical protein [Nocardia]MCM6776083.1 hypothetical protein [Nocardia pulmonis]MCM6788590.1 hypothetical protein [Nocardia sp. CDC159]
MGTQKWQIDPESFGKAAGRTQHVADRIGAVWSKLDSGLAALGSPWGTCRTGDQFANGEGGNGYLKTKTGVGQGLVGPQGMVPSIGNLADGQRKTGEKVREFETGNAGRFKPKK